MEINNNLTLLLFTVKWLISEVDLQLLQSALSRSEQNYIIYHGLTGCCRTLL